MGSPRAPSATLVVAAALWAMAVAATGAAAVPSSPAAVRGRTVGRPTPSRIEDGLVREEVPAGEAVQMVLPGCSDALGVFEEDYVGGRCLPEDVEKELEDVAKATLEVFKTIEEAECNTTRHQHDVLTARIGQLEAASVAADLCGDNRFVLEDLVEVPAAPEGDAATPAEVPRVLPGCSAELRRFENDYVGFRCLPEDAEEKLVELAKDTLEVFKAIEKAECDTTQHQRDVLVANIGVLMSASAAANMCGFPYSSIPDYSPDSYQCHDLSDCEVIIKAFEADFVNHGCMAEGNERLDAMATDLLEVLKDIEKDGCCAVTVQRRRLMSDLMRLSMASQCLPRRVVRLALGVGAAVPRSLRAA